MIHLYEDEEMSRGEIARRFDTSVQTITRVLSRHGVIFEGRTRNPNAERTPEEQAQINAKIAQTKTGQKTGPRKPPEYRRCEECGNQFEYRAGRTGERFCSRQCRTDYLVRHNREGARAEYDLDPKRCPCGGPIPYEYRHTRQFCSPEHRAQYSAKRQPEPDKYVTFNCLNCDKEVTRYKGYGNGHNKYCSNTCAQKHTKTRRFYTVEGFDIVFESSYEALFWGLCMVLKLPVERYDREQGVEWKPGQWYAPDFWLPSLETAVELKGLADEDDTARWEAFSEQRGKLKIMYASDLLELVSGKSDLLAALA